MQPSMSAQMRVSSGDVLCRPAMPLGMSVLKLICMYQAGVLLMLSLEIGSCI